MKNKNLVTAQTAYNLDRLRRICGYKDIDRIVDKLVREKMIALRGYENHE